MSNQLEVTALPFPLSEPNDVRVVGLIPKARHGKLVLYVGAGVSIDAGLPGGAGLANSFCDRLEAHGIDLPGVDRDDLVAVADAAVAIGSLQSAQEMAVDVAGFTTASPSRTHRLLALLLLEGAACVMSTNWDTCIERSAPQGEHISGLATDGDVHMERQVGLLKVHGCANRPSTVLLTSEQLESPPVWASDEVGARIAGSTVVFIGIGDVAGYVAKRLELLLSALGPSHSVAVVMPDIESNWNATRWAALLPELSSEYKLELTAAQFTDSLARAWVNDSLQGVEAIALGIGIAALNAAVAAALVGIRSCSPERVLKWMRGAAPGIEPGTSVMHAAETKEALCALSYIVRESGLEEIPDSGPLGSGGSKFDLNLNLGGQPGPVAARSARNRVAEHRSNGRLNADEPITVVCAGHIGPLEPSLPEKLALDVVASASTGNLIDGPSLGPVTLIAAAKILDEITV